MNIKAIFKGKNVSLGYENGKEYDLRFDVNDGQIWVRRKINGNKVRYDSYCPYASLRSFLDNWDVL